MNVYYYDFSRDTHTLSELGKYLGQQRYEYCKSMKSEVAGLRSAYVFMLLRYALKKEYGIDEMPVFEKNAYGKPFLKNFPDIFFSMSHTKKSVLCAVSDVPVGADIQDIRPLRIGIGKKFLTANEFQNVAQITDENERNRQLCRIWCIKESYGKMTGKGFGEGFTDIDSNELISSGRAFVTQKDGCFISVCI